MKKILTIAIAVLSVFALCACGGDNKTTTAADGGDKQATGSVYDTGTFTVEVPKGMTVMQVNDIMSDDENAIDPDIIHIAQSDDKELYWYKGAYVIIYYYPETDSIFDIKSVYDDAVDIDPITINGVEWKGFDATSLDVPLTYVSGKVGDDMFVVTIMKGEYDLDINSPELETILGSLQASK